MKTAAAKYVPKNNSDELNADYLFSTTATDLLVGIALGQLDPVELAINTLRDRGQDVTDGQWIGFDRHGRMENLMKKHKVQLRPVELIEGDIQANADEWTPKQVQALKRIAALLKTGRQSLALDIALASGETVRYYTLSKRTK